MDIAVARIGLDDDPRPTACVGDPGSDGRVAREHGPGVQDSAKNVAVDHQRGTRLRILHIGHRRHCSDRRYGPVVRQASSDVTNQHDALRTITARHDLSGVSDRNIACNRVAVGVIFHEYPGDPRRRH